MALLNLPPAEGTRRRRRRDEESSLDNLAQRMAELKRQEAEQKKERQADKQERQKEQKAAERQEKTEEKKEGGKSLWGKITSTAADVFQADTEADKRRRRERGEPELYADQQAQKKQTAEAFTEDKADEFERGKQFNFAKDEIDTRRTHYEAKGIDIDQLISDKMAYDKLIDEFGGDTRKVALARARGELPEDLKGLEKAAVRFQETLDKAENAEQTYQRTQRVEAGAESALGQAERGLVRGIAEPLLGLPSSVQVAAGTIGKAVAPAGSGLQRGSEALLEEGVDNREALARQMVESGYGASPADNPLIAGLSQGAGSLAASLTAAGAVGRTSAAAGLFGVQAGTEQAIEAEKAGKGDIQAAATGIGAGVVEGLLEKVGLDKFLGASGKPFKQAVKRMVTEGTQEAAQSLSQSGVEATYTDVDLAEAIQQAAQEGGIGAIVGGGASLPITIAQNLQQKGLDPDSALQVGLDVQDRMNLVLDEAKAEGAPAAGEAPAPAAQAADVPQTGANVPGRAASVPRSAPSVPDKGGVVPEPKTKTAAAAAPENVKSTTIGKTAGQYYKKWGAEGAKDLIKQGQTLPEQVKAIKQGKNTIATAENDNYKMYVTDFKGGSQNAPTIFVEDKKSGRVAREMFWMGEAEPGFPDNFDDLPRQEQAKLEAQYKLDNFYKDSKAFDTYYNNTEFDTAVAQVHEKATQKKPSAAKPEKQAAAPKDQKSRKSAQRREALDALADYDESTTTGRDSPRTAEELVKLADQLNKAAQAGAILRRGDYRSKKNLGAFVRTKKKGKTAEEVIKLQNAVIEDPRMYATVLAHELSHAIEYTINGNTSSTLKLFEPLSAEERTQITDELKDVVDTIEGKDIAQAKPEYYYKPTEMLARYVELLVLQGEGRAQLVAPLVTERFGELVVEQPLVGDLMAAIQGELDKGFKNFTPDFAKDLRQMYRKHLGKRAGDMAYNAEVIRRAEVQRSEELIGKLFKRKFKGIKDDAALLFRAAEAVKVTKDGEPEFGTHDFVDAFTEKDYKKLQEAGWERIGPAADDGKEGFVYTRVRYTPEQAEKIFKQLTPEGQQLIKEFTAAKEEAKDEFNRELMKDVYNIDSKLEGWVHHFFEDKPFSRGKLASLRLKTAGAKKQRKGAEGYVEDFRKATEKALLELDRSDINNAFIAKQLARISKPIAKGQKPDPGWVEVVADQKGGLRLPGEGMQIMIKPDEGKAIRVAQKRYQVPRALADHYREIRDLPEEVNIAARTLTRIGKYWTINVLVHPGTAATNFFSGGLQYAAKILNDFYLDLLTANFSMNRTRHNLMAPLQTMTPRGWTNAPDWIYGGYRSTLAGQVATGPSDTRTDRALDKYGDRMLYVFSLVDRYWKKVIAISEGGRMRGANTRRITQRLQEDEKKIVAELNKTIDTYAFDYDNKPLWMSKFDRHGGKIVKPFMTYPYKLTKFYADHMAAGFDRSRSWQERTSKVLTFATLVAFIAFLYERQEEEMTTAKGTEDTPLSLRPGGRVFFGRSGAGEELFVRTAKYPWFNLTSMGKAAVDRNGTEIIDLLREQFGTVGPGAELFMLATGNKDQFSQYTPTSVILAEQAGSFIPGFRIAGDIGKMIDESGRKQKTFVQGIMETLPVWGSEETRAKLRGDKRTIRIPDEPEEGRSITSRSSTARDVTREASDTLISLLSGIYIRRIDPKEARRQELREIRDDAEQKIRDLLEAGNEADANAMGEEYGLEIPRGTLEYYRRQRRKRP